MATEKSDIELDDDFVETEGDVEAADVPVSKTNLTKRRLIDNMLEERRLKRQISEYDFDL
ncbi:PA3496 family putative envelope integrity protein [Pseudomonas asuensis]|jgi:hypothetical protein|uniref:Leucyl-tRNA synthetase n=1 Tax=Pseudomonas asuensis TaxID=1825787 RepID=A0ABQ2H1V4_9PSED|nr:hypothetical protein [Pseudomonas asuensis]GGM27070.1 hypothetical protein GCM10009425_42020 [Pseudomonas asuensis]